MRRNLYKTLLLIPLLVGACGNMPAATPLPIVVEATQFSPDVDATAEVDSSSSLKSYDNSAFGLSFQFPSSWFGPEEYISGQTLRLEIGSDRVYPYASDPSERIYDLINSYNIVIQYSKNDKNQFWKEIYQSLLLLQDGESSSDVRSLMIRVRQLHIGRFEGIEYISTLSDTAQTEPTYIRQAILFDDQSNVLTMMGQPINVDVQDGANWQEIYRMIDEQNQSGFEAILRSIRIE